VVNFFRTHKITTRTGRMTLTSVQKYSLRQKDSHFHDSETWTRARIGS